MRSSALILWRLCGSLWATMAVAVAVAMAVAVPTILELYQEEQTEHHFATQTAPLLPFPASLLVLPAVPSWISFDLLPILVHPTNWRPSLLKQPAAFSLSKDEA